MGAGTSWKIEEEEVITKEKGDTLDKLSAFCFILFYFCIYVKVFLEIDFLIFLITRGQECYKSRRRLTGKETQRRTELFRWDAAPTGQAMIEDVVSSPEVS